VIGSVRMVNWTVDRKVEISFMHFFVWGVGVVEWGTLVVPHT
jgi:hypothetical protein